MEEFLANPSQPFVSHESKRIWQNKHRKDDSVVLRYRGGKKRRQDQSFSKSLPPRVLEVNEKCLSIFSPSLILINVIKKVTFTLTYKKRGSYQKLRCTEYLQCRQIPFSPIHKEESETIRTFP